MERREAIASLPEKCRNYCMPVTMERPPSPPQIHPGEVVAFHERGAKGLQCWMDLGNLPAREHVVEKGVPQRLAMPLQGFGNDDANLERVAAACQLDRLQLVLAVRNHGGRSVVKGMLVERC